MTTKILNHAFIWRQSVSGSDVKLIELDTFNEDHNKTKKVFKFTYQAHNATEKFTGEFFDGKQFNPIFTPIDLGIKSDSSSYLNTEEQAKERISKFTEAGIKFIKLLF